MKSSSTQALRVITFSGHLMFSFATSCFYSQLFAVERVSYRLNFPNIHTTSESSDTSERVARMKRLKDEAGKTTFFKDHDFWELLRSESVPLGYTSATSLILREHFALCRSEDYSDLEKSRILIFFRWLGVPVPPNHSWKPSEETQEEVSWEPAAEGSLIVAYYNQWIDGIFKNFGDISCPNRSMEKPSEDEGHSTLTGSRAESFCKVLKCVAGEQLKNYLSTEEWQILVKSLQCRLKNLDESNPTVLEIDGTSMSLAQLADNYPQVFTQ